LFCVGLLSRAFVQISETCPHGTHLIEASAHNSWAGGHHHHHPMRIIAFIEQPAVIEKILTHLALWPARAHSPSAGDALPLSLHQGVAA